VHFPDADFVTEEFLAQVEAEAPKLKLDPGGFQVGDRWFKKRARNEILARRRTHRGPGSGYSESARVGNRFRPQP
jgi:hypothetical protein